MEYWNRKMPERSAVHMPAPQKPKEEAPRPALSGSLQSLLSMAMVNELSQPQMLDLLRDLYPYAAPHDRNAIADILGYEQAVKELAYHSARPNLGGFSMKKRYLTAQDRILGMLEVFKKHNPQSAANFSQLERVLQMQKKLSRIDPNRPESMFSLLPLFGGPDLSGMGQMMNMVKNMSEKGGMEQLMKNMSGAFGGGGPGKEKP